MGSGIGGLSTWEREYRVMNERGPGRVSPFLITMMVPNMAAGQLAIALGATGPSQCPVRALRHEGGDRGGARADPTQRRRRGDSRILGSPITPSPWLASAPLGREPPQRRPSPSEPSLRRGPRRSHEHEGAEALVWRARSTRSAAAQN